MFKTSYLREVRKEKYEQSDYRDDDAESAESSAGASAIQGWESLQELNSRFARYINRARVLEQRNAVFRKQLETLQRMEEASGLEEAFNQQISTNRQRIRELSADHAKLERQLKEACRMLDEFTSKYRNECEYQEHLRGTLEQLNKEADNALLRNLECQIESQFLQDDVNGTKDRHKKNLAEIQTYVNILHQINQTMPLLPNVSVGISEEQEKQLAQRRLPGLQSQLEEYKSALCQLQAQKQRLQNETAGMEQTIKSTQDGFDNEIQAYNEQMESLRRDIEEAERSLERITNECRHLAMYQTSLENELDRYKRIIENEDNRLNSAIIGTPITLFTTNYRYTHTPTVTSRGRDITQQAIQDITSIKPRQKIQAKKVLHQKKKELSPRDVLDSSQEDRGGAGGDGESVNRTEHRPLSTGALSPQDVPDGAQISKAFDTLCNIVRDRMRKYKNKPEPIADFYTKGRYVLVTGDSSFLDPCFYTSTPSAGHIYVTIRDGMMPPYDPYGFDTPTPPVPPQPMPMPMPMPVPMPGPMPMPMPDPGPFGGGGKKNDKGGKGKDNGGGKGKGKNRDPSPSKPKDPPGPAPQSAGGPGDPAPAPGPGPAGPSPCCPTPGPSRDAGPEPQPEPLPRSSRGPRDGDSFYEKVEVHEHVEKISKDRRVKGYEDTAMVVETMIEKTSKKNP